MIRFPRDRFILSFADESKAPQSEFPQLDPNPEEYRPGDCYLLQVCLRLGELDSECDKSAGSYKILHDYGCRKDAEVEGLQFFRLRDIIEIAEDIFVLTAADFTCKEYGDDDENDHDDEIKMSDLGETKTPDLSEIKVISSGEVIRKRNPYNSDVGMVYRIAGDRIKYCYTDRKNFRDAGYSFFPCVSSNNGRSYKISYFQKDQTIRAFDITERKMIGVWKVESESDSPFKDTLSYSLLKIGNNHIILWRVVKNKDNGDDDKDLQEIVILNMSTSNMAKYYYLPSLPYKLESDSPLFLESKSDSSLSLESKSDSSLSLESKFNSSFDFYPSISSISWFSDWNDCYYLCILKNEILVMSLENNKVEARFSLLRSGELPGEHSNTIPISLHRKCFSSSKDHMVIWHWNRSEPRSNEEQRLFILSCSNDGEITLKPVTYEMINDIDPQCNCYEGGEIDYVVEIKQTGLVSLLSGRTFNIPFAERIRKTLGITSNNCFFELQTEKYDIDGIGIYSFETKRSTVIDCKLDLNSIVYLPPSRRECSEFSSRLIHLMLAELRLPLLMDLIYIIVDYLFL